MAARKRATLVSPRAARRAKCYSQRRDVRRWTVRRNVFGLEEVFGYEKSSFSSDARIARNA